jgi:hypothetical protein
MGGAGQRSSCNEVDTGPHQYIVYSQCGLLAWGFCGAGSGKQGNAVALFKLEALTLAYLHIIYIPFSM